MLPASLLADSPAGGQAEARKIHQNTSKRTREPKIAPQIPLGRLFPPLAALGALLGEVSVPAHQQGLLQDFTPGTRQAAPPPCLTAACARSLLSPLPKQKSHRMDHLRSTLGFTNCWRTQGKSA